MCSLSYRPQSCSKSKIFNHPGIVIEVGPQPQGVVRAEIVEIQRKVVGFALDFLKSAGECSGEGKKTVIAPERTIEANNVLLK